MPRGPGRFPISLAFAWTGFITAALWLALSFVFVFPPREMPEIVLLGLTQVVVYSLVLASFVYTLGTPVPEALALRRASLLLCLVAALLGAALQIPATLLSSSIEHFFPMPEAVLKSRIARITPDSPLHGVAIFAVVAGLGPCVEEFFFRGALFGALRHSYGARVAIAVVSLCFALGHLDLRLLLPLFAAALVIGDVRERSGSIWPGLALHAAFNSATLVVVFGGGSADGKSPSIPAFFAVLGCAAAFALLLLARRLALSSPVAQNARQSDAF